MVPRQDEPDALAALRCFGRVCGAGASVGARGTALLLPSSAAGSDMAGRRKVSMASGTSIESTSSKVGIVAVLGTESAELGTDREFLALWFP